MTTPPLPASNCVRVNLDYTQTDGLQGGSRFYLGFTGSSAQASDLVAIANTIHASWTANLSHIVNTDWSLTLIDVMDISTASGQSGANNTAVPGAASGVPLAAQLANNIEYKIARRYRGGKPRMYLPPGVDADMQDPSHWTTAHVTGVTAGIGNFFSQIVGPGPGSMGTLTHVNVSYFSGFKNIANTSGRERAVPQYRATALVDPVIGYVAKALISSQRRRRVATTP